MDYSWIDRMAGDTFRTTIDGSVLIADSLDRPYPGLVVIFSGGRPRCGEAGLSRRTR